MTFARDRRARRNRKRQSLGRYYVARRGEPAYIELIVDEIVKDVPAPFDRFQLPRDLTVGRVLFHEVGHHLHLTSRGVGRSNESSAELWKDRLSRMHIQRRYGYMRPFTPLLRLVRNVIKHRWLTLWCRDPRRRFTLEPRRPRPRGRPCASTAADADPRCTRSTPA